MAFIIKDRVKEGTVSTGTGAVTLGGASATFDPFQSYMVDGDTTYYAIVHTTSGTDEWEVGIGTWNTGNTLTRTTVLAGSNGTSAENFSAGTKDVFMTYPASKAAIAGEDVTFADINVTGTVDGRDVAADGTKLDGIDTSADVTDATTVAAAGALMKSGGTMTGNLILNADPTAALGAATKEYVDTIASAGIHYHDPVRVETPSALTSSYNNGSSGVGATLTNSGTQAALVIDGVTMALNDRVLVYNQTNEAHNGIYTVTNVGSASTNWVMTRATDADSYGASDPDSFGKGDAFFVKEGNTGAGELYVMTTAGTITFGATAIHFSQVAETAIYNAGTGITLNGTTFSIGQDVATAANVTFNQVTAAIIGNVTGNLTGDVTGNADTATALETARTISLTGDVTGSATFDGSANASITATVQDDSHAHVISNVDGLQTALDGKTATSRTITAGNGLTGGGNLTANRTLNVGAGSGITVTADAVSHADTSTQASVNNSGRTYIQDITLDGFGHITGLTSATETVTDTTYSAGSGLSLSGTTFSHTDTSSQASVDNSNGTVIQDITLDTYGHITGINSVNLDGRYYTESEADSRFVNVSGDTMTGALGINGSAGSGYPLFVQSSQRYLIGLNNTAADTNYPWLVHATTDSKSSLIFHFNAVADRHVFREDGSASFTSLTLNGNNAFHDGYHPNADKWTTARTLTLSGDASGSVSWDGSSNATLSVTVANDSHTHNKLIAIDDRDMKPNTSGITSGNFAIRAFFSSKGGMTGTANSDYHDVLVLDTYSDSSGGGPNAISFDKGNSAGNPAAYLWKGLWGGTTWGTGQRIFADNYHPNADKWTTARTLSLSGDASGSVSWDGSANATLSVTVNNDSHSHSNYALTTHNHDGRYVYSDYINSGYNWNTFNYGTDEGVIARVESSATNPPASDVYNWSLFQQGSNVRGSQIALSAYAGGNRMYFRGSNTGAAWNSWDRVFADNYHPNADKWTTARTLSLSGDASGSVSWDGSANATLSVSNVDAETLDGKNHTNFGATLATYGTTAGSSGRIRCTAPFSTNSAHMFQVTVSVYSGYVQHTYVVAGYMYPSTNQWYAPTCVYNGTGSPDIVVGRDSNGKAYISIANGAYTGVRVHNMTLGYQTNVADTYDPWTITINGATENSTTPSIYKTWTSGNDGSGSGLDADMLDGQHASAFLNKAGGWHGDLGSNGFTRYQSMSTGGGEVVWTQKSGQMYQLMDGAHFTYESNNGFFGSYNSVYGNLTGIQATAANTLTVKQFDGGSANLVATGNVTAYSDERLKENIATIDNALDKVTAIRGVTYNRKDIEDTSRQAGVIAQEVEKVLPEVVMTDEGGTKSVAYGNMVGLLIEAIKEQQTQIDELKARLEA